MENNGDACTVCGGTDTNLVDGFYYCVECGTQNTNVRETMLEEKILTGGTFGLKNKRKVILRKKESIEMSGEWYKWHAYNFMITGLADELISIGAKPSFKIKLLWIWTRYIKKFQNRAEINKTSVEEIDQTVLPTFIEEEDDNMAPNSDDEELQENTRASYQNRYLVHDGSWKDIKVLSKPILLAMLYVALNLDESDIQLSHLYRFIHQKLLSLSDPSKFVPDDINVKKISFWETFQKSRLGTMQLTRMYAMSLFKKLKLGTPKLPNLRTMVDNFLTELCLPNDIKPLVYALMHFRNCNYLDIDQKSMKGMLRIPDYEVIVMTYILVAIKICFGLDNEYEIKLSDIVEKVNEEQNLEKSYRIGNSEPSNRLFSFRAWCNYLQFRRIMLSKFNVYIANKFCTNVDEIVFFEHTEETPVGKATLQDKIAMDLINRIPDECNFGVIPKECFLPTLTIMSDYTDVVIDHCQDTEVKLILAEDFRRYSLKYICEDLELLDDNMENVIRGVEIVNKIENKKKIGRIICNKRAKTNMVYVKNCENRNWMKTNPPTLEHVTCAENDASANEAELSDKASDYGYHSENTSKEKDNEKTIANNHTTNEEVEQVINEEMVNDETNDITHTVDTSVKVANNKINKLTQQQRLTSVEHELIKEIDNNIEANNVTFIKDLSVGDENNTINKVTQRQRKAIRENRFNFFTQETDSIDECTEKGQENEKQKTSDINVSKQNMTDEILAVTDEVSNKKNEEQTKATKEKVNIITIKDKIILEEDENENIFDDCFEDIDYKEECERNSIIGNMDDIQAPDIHPSDDNYFQNDDFDCRSEVSGDAPLFNPDTFDREGTIKELILFACKKYKIVPPAEYKTKEPMKKKPIPLGDEPKRKRSKKTYEGKVKIGDLLTDYYNAVQSDFVTKAQREMSIAVRNAELQNNASNLQCNEVDRDSIMDTGFNSPVPHSDRNSTVGMIDHQNFEFDKTKTEIFDETHEEALFEDVEMNLDDLIPQGDPKYDEKKYNTDQLYIKVGDVKEELLHEDIMNDPDLDEIVMKKIEECEKEGKFKVNKPTSKEDYSSDDDVPLSVLKEEAKLVGEMFRQKDNFEHLIKKENIPEYQYWMRHYNNRFMVKSREYYTRFDQELTENIPSNFFIVIQECSFLVNCTNFNLYKKMMHFEEYLVAKCRTNGGRHGGKKKS